MLKPALLALVAGSLSAVAPYAPDEPRTDMNAIARVECDRGMGTVFWITRTRIITAAHVATLGNCRIAGVPVHSVYDDGNADLSEMAGLENEHHLNIDCAPPREGEALWATGFAEGRYRHTARLLAIGQQVHGSEPSAEGQEVMLGEVFPGMSGGPIADRHGHVRAITNRRYYGQPQLASGRAMADSFLCAGRHQ